MSAIQSAAKLVITIQVHLCRNLAKLRQNIDQYRQIIPGESHNDAKKCPMHFDLGGFHQSLLENCM